MSDWPQPPPTGSPSAGPPAYPPVYSPPTNSNATVALVLGILSIVTCGLFGPVAIVFARKARKEISTSGGMEGGDSFATAGFVMGIVGTVIAAIQVLAISAFFAIAFLGESATQRFESIGQPVSTFDETPVAPTSTLETASAAGKPCVGLSDPLPAGAPDVPITPGPPPSDLVVEDILVGEGAPVPAGATVTVQYIGVACSTGTIFDSSWGRGGQLATFGLDQVIEGWTEGIVGMQVGGQRLLVIPPELGYGDGGSPPDIPPGETLIFVVDLVAFVP